MEKEILERLAQMEKRVDFLYAQAEKAERARQIKMVISIVIFLLPVLILLYMVPKILGGMNENLEMFL